MSQNNTRATAAAPAYPRHSPRQRQPSSGRSPAQPQTQPRPKPGPVPQAEYPDTSPVTARLSPRHSPRHQPSHSPVYPETQSQSQPCPSLRHNPIPTQPETYVQTQFQTQSQTDVDIWGCMRVCGGGEGVRRSPITASSTSQPRSNTTPTQPPYLQMSVCNASQFQCDQVTMGISTMTLSEAV